MTLTTEQLDELEARARDLIGRMHVETDPLLGVSTCNLLHLVAVYRAALAWSEARDDVRAFADEIDRLHLAPITVGHEVRREALGGVVKARAVALESALRGTP